MNNSAGKKGSQRPSAIYSAALQDHLLQKLNLGSDFGLRSVQKRRPPPKLPSLSHLSEEIGRLQKKKQILPFDSEKLKALKEQRDQQQRQHQYKSALTWAQKLGLVSAPPPPLSASEWARVEQQSKLRHDSSSCCSICLEDYKLQSQTILSCSHTFHAQCLAAYEQHTRLRSCPICRRQDYQKKHFDWALRAYTLNCILTLQRVFRGSRVRITLYTSLLNSSYTATSLRFNRRLIAFKMWRLSQGIQKNTKFRAHKFNSIIQKMQAQHQLQKNNLLDQLVQEQKNRFVDQNQIQEKLLKIGVPKEAKKHDGVDWEAAKLKAVNRKQDNCSICLNALWTKPVYLLSCSHLFHVNCIEGFQRYTIQIKKCPFCRSQYTKRLLKAK